MQLATFYAEPGFLLLATDHGGERLGCVGLRAQADARVGEVRRLFVRPQARGRRLGHAIVNELLEHAQAAGFTRLVLNTLPAMVEAISLYESLGFQGCAPYTEEPLGGVLYYALDLGD